jgi:hypothetical protein
LVFHNYFVFGKSHQSKVGRLAWGLRKWNFFLKIPKNVKIKKVCGGVVVVLEVSHFYWHFPLWIFFAPPPPPQRACWEESLKGEVIMNEPVLTCTITIVSLVWFDLGIGWAFLQKNHHFGKKKLPFEKPNILSLFFFPS